MAKNIYKAVNRAVDSPLPSQQTFPRPRAQPQPREKKEAPALTGTDRAKEQSGGTTTAMQPISVKVFTKWVMKQRKLGEHRKPTSSKPAALVSLAARLATPVMSYGAASLAFKGRPAGSCRSLMSGNYTPNNRADGQQREVGAQPIGTKGWRTSDLRGLSSAVLGGFSAGEHRRSWDTALGEVVPLSTVHGGGGMLSRVGQAFKIWAPRQAGQMGGPFRGRAGRCCGSRPAAKGCAEFIPNGTGSGWANFSRWGVRVGRKGCYESSETEVPKSNSLEGPVVRSI
ncbi:hypothetical protein B0H16DRAFT_1692623 [Mycena metata]|uniref:Uncharacterized protein n=1 Tax=Mycena metata TaxID=1033252 RepID=A0AAD7IMI7_9AGAR|nr:hypothetical protein B0H16DRAFT_1692623 [Mycena metata]